MSRRPTLKRATGGHYPDREQHHCPSPAYIAALVGAAGGNLSAIARAIGSNARTVRRWTEPATEVIPYLAQYALEALVIEQLVLAGKTPAAALKHVTQLRADHQAPPQD